MSLSDLRKTKKEKEKSLQDNVSGERESWQIHRSISNLTKHVNLGDARKERELVMGQVITLLLKLICFHFIDEDTEAFFMPFSRVADTWSEFKITVYPRLCCFSETLKRPGPFIREMEFSLLPLHPALGSPWGCPGCASEVAQSPCSLESIYPMYPVCRCVCIHLCICVCIIHIYIVSGNSKSCAPFFPKASRRRSGIWLDLNHTRILSLYYRLEEQENEGDTLFSVGS